MIVMRTNVIMNALLTRGIDYGTPATSVIRAAASDLPVKAVAVLTGRPDYFLAAKKELKSLKDLKGKRIAIGTFGAAADIALRVVLRQDGLDPERDVIRLQMGGGDSRFPALVGGTVDVTILNFPFNLQAEKLGFNVLLWLGERLEMPLSGVGVRDETIQKNPGQVFGTIRAFYRAVVFAKANPEETIQAFMDWTRVDTMNSRPLSIPVILGTARKGRMSAHAARFMLGQIEKRDGIRTELIDISKLPMPVDDAGEGIKDPAFSEKMALADALVIVTPEYNHSFPGLLKHILDSCLKEYIHKAAGIVGVSAGPFGGVRVIQDLLPVIRELGLVNIFWDVNVGNIAKVFDESGILVDQAFIARADKFLNELIWMAKTLRHGRDNMTLES